MSKFTFVELFAGIGGVSFGFEKVGGECVLAAEYDPERAGKRQFAQEAYKLLHPSVPVVGDVFELKGEDVPDHDLLSFTFPCQSFSVAGKRGGFEDARGTSYFEAMRIAREKRPKIIFAENVKGLVNHDKGKTLDTIIQVANDSGYIIDYEILNSKFFGVPQNRDRWFLIGVREDLIESEPWIVEGNTIIPKSKKRIGEWAKTFNFDWPAQESVTTRLRDILETEVDEKYYLDDEKTAKLVAQLERNDDNIIIDPSQSKREGKPREYVDISPTITAREYKEPRMVAQLEAKKPDERMSRQAIETFNESNQPKEHGDMIQAYNRQHLKDGICPTLTTRPEGFKTASLPIVNGIAIKEATKKGYAIAEEGDSVNVQFPDSKTRRGRVGKQIANTLEASSINQGVVEQSEDAPKYRIRKLTPKECLRLQNFSDDAYERLAGAGLSNSQIYKMAGNAVTVSVIEAIGERLLRFL